LNDEQSIIINGECIFTNQQGKKLDLSQRNISNSSIIEELVELGKFTELEEVDLSGNNLTSIPSEIWNLPKLRKLNCENNKIIELTDNFLDCASLERITLQNNPLDLEKLEILISKIRSKLIMTTDIQYKKISKILPQIQDIYKERI
jgi:Leucine-rich repeat (LRR) protein